MFWKPNPRSTMPPAVHSKTSTGRTEPKNSLIVNTTALICPFWGFVVLLVAKGTQNHPHVAFAGSEFGDAKTGAFAGLRRKGMRRFDCGGSAKQALLSPAGRRCEQTGPVFTRSAFTPPFSLQAIMRRLKTADWRPRCGRKRKNKNAKTLTNNVSAFPKSTRSRYTTYTTTSNQKNI